MNKFEIKEELEKILKKLFKRDKILYGQIMKKIEEVASSGDIEHYKNLKYGMKFFKRVQLGHFVLVFNFDKKNDLVVFWNFDHHDNIYKWRPKEQCCLNYKIR